MTGFLALAGCGDSGTTAESGEGTARRPTSKKAFAEKANRICNRNKQNEYRAVISYLERHRNSKEPRPQRINRAIRVAYLPRIERQIKEIRALPPPRGEGWQVTAFIVALKEGIYSMRRSSSADLKRSFQHSAELARALDITACVI